MALSCRDRTNHFPVPPGIVIPQICHANRPFCVEVHATNVDVCDVCHLHTAHMLLLDAPIGAPVPQNRLRLSHGHGYHAVAGLMVPIDQPGVSPPELPPGAPAVAPFVAEWRTPAEIANRKITSPPNPNPPFEGFLTRCCRQCEQLIQSEIHHRSTGIITTIPPATWEQAPHVSCTCKSTLGIRAPGTNRLCLPHRTTEWNNLVNTKNGNDRWLRNVQWDAKAQKLVAATLRTKRARFRNRYWRACRVSSLLC